MPITLTARIVDGVTKLTFNSTDRFGEDAGKIVGGNGFFRFNAPDGTQGDIWDSAAEAEAEAFAYWANR